MDAMTVTALIVGIGACTSRVLYAWLQGRAAVQLARLSENGLNSRVRTLPPGSRLTEQRADRGEVVIEVGRIMPGHGGADE